MNIFTGRIILSVSESAPDSSFSPPGRIIDGISLLFFPRAELPMSGLAVSATYDWQGSSSISPILTTFGVISAEQPIWLLIEAGDIKSVQQILGERHFKPWDRDAASGNSLLAVSFCPFGQGVLLLTFAFSGLLGTTGSIFANS
jgi:hypothetical protein